MQRYHESWWPMGEVNACESACSAAAALRKTPSGARSPNIPSKFITNSSTPRNALQHDAGLVHFTPWPLVCACEDDLPELHCSNQQSSSPISGPGLTRRLQSRSSARLSFLPPPPIPTIL